MATLSSPTCPTCRLPLRRGIPIQTSVGLGTLYRCESASCINRIDDELRAAAGIVVFEHPVLKPCACGGTMWRNGRVYACSACGAAKILVGNER